MEQRDEGSRIRALVRQAVSSHRRGTPYAAEFRETVCAFARRRLAAGEQLPTIARQIGLSYWTLWGWFRPAQRKRAEPAPPIVPVRVEPSPSSSARRFTLHGPRGVRVEDLDLDALSELLRRLS